MSKEVKKIENEVTNKSMMKSALDPVKSILDDLRGDYLETTTTDRDLISTIKSYKSYVHLMITFTNLLDYLNRNIDTIEDMDITIMESYIEYILDIVNPRVVLLDNKIKEFKEVKE